MPSDLNVLNEKHISTDRKKLLQNHVRLLGNCFHGIIIEQFVIAQLLVIISDYKY